MDMAEAEKLENEHKVKCHIKGVKAANGRQMPNVYVFELPDNGNVSDKTPTSVTEPTPIIEVANTEKPVEIKESPERIKRKYKKRKK